MANQLSNLLTQLIDKSYSISKNLSDINTSLIKAENMIGLKSENPPIGEIIQQGITRNQVSFDNKTKTFEEINENKAKLGLFKIIKREDIKTETAEQKINKTNEEKAMLEERKIKNQPTQPLKLESVNNEQQEYINKSNNNELQKVEQSIQTEIKNKQNGSQTQEKVDTSSETQLTPLQTLLNLVNQKGKITLDEASKILNSDESLIETWARILNSSNLIKLQYPIIGKPVMSRI